MNRLKKVIALAAFMSISGICYATSGVTFHFKDGTAASFTFSAKPKITMTSSELIVSSTETKDVTYLISNVQRFYFDDDIVTGIGSASSSTPVSNNLVFQHTDGVIVVSGLHASESVRVASANGTSVGTYKANGDGTLQIDLSSTSPGVYVIATEGGVCFKIVNK